MSSLNRLVALMRKALAVAYATWNPADKDASITLSGGNLVVSTTTTTAQVRATIGKSAGKWYWEVLLGTGGGLVGPKIGVAQLGSSTANWTGQDGISVGYYPNNGGIYNASTLTTSYATSTAGDTLGFALDATAGTLDLYKNGTFIGQVASLTGTIYPACGTAGANAVTYTANFGATPFTYAPPFGYNAGLY